MNLWATRQRLYECRLAAGQVIGEIFLLVRFLLKENELAEVIPPENKGDQK